MINRSVDERAVLQGLQSWSSYIWSQTATFGVKQLHMESNSYIWSQTVDICLYRNSTIIHVARGYIGFKRAGPSGLAELENYAVPIHVARLRMQPRCAREAIMRIRIPSNVFFWGKKRVNWAGRASRHMEVAAKVKDTPKG